MTASACIYRVPARPAWNTRHTLAQFTLTAGILGPLFAAAIGAGDPRWLVAVAGAMAGAQLALFAARFFACNASDSLALRGTARLLSSVLARRLILRGALLVIGAIALPSIVAGPYAVPGSRLEWFSAWRCSSATAAEILGRYLFFVSVVPQHQAAPYIAVGSEAA